MNGQTINIIQPVQPKETVKSKKTIRLVLLIIAIIAAIVGGFYFWQKSFGTAQGQTLAASLFIYGNIIISEINQDIYGNNVCWLDNGIWGWNSEGFNLAVLEKIKEINPSIIRYPGGGYALYFHWRDSIGPLPNRPPGTDEQGRSFQIKFGVDEFMLFAEEIGAKPLITVNTLNGTAEEAAAWVAYMNGRKGNITTIGIDSKGVDWKNVDFWAKEREKNGHPEPYDVRYWEIGNEDFFFWTSTAYYAVFEKFSEKMKTVDPSIKTGAVAQRKWWRNNAWEPWLGPANKENFDFAAYHYYRGGLPFKYETLDSSGKRNFVSVGTNSGTFKFKLNLGGSGNNWVCAFSDNTSPLLDAQDNRVGFSTPPPGTVWNSWGLYSKEFILSQGNHNFSIECTAGLKTLYLRDVILMQKDSTGKFQTVEELSYSSIEDASKSLWAESKKLSSFMVDYRSELNSPKTLVFFTEFNSKGYDRELVDLRSAIFISDLLIQMIKSRVDSAQYWLLTDYPNKWTNLIDYANPKITRPNFLVFKLFSSKVKGQLLEMQLNTPAYSFGGSSIPLVEGIAGKNPEGNIFLALVNKSINDYVSLNIQLNDFEPAATAKAFILNGPALGSDNEEQNNVTVKETNISMGSNSFNYTLEPHSLTIIEIPAKTVSAADTTAPSVPANLSATAVSPSQINLSWTVSTDPAVAGQVTSGVTGYRVYRCNGTTCTPTTQIATPTANSYSDTGLSVSTAYRYRVTAIDAAGNVSSYSSIASAATQAPADTTPPTISSISSSSITYNSATITWTTNEAATSEVEYGTNTAYGGQTAPDSTLVTSHSVNLTGLSASTTYHYKVKSKDASNNEKTSSDYVFTTASPPLPINNPPVLAAIGDKSVKEKEQLTFTVSATDADGDALTYSAQNLPQGSNFNLSTSTFSWKPEYTQSGAYNIIFTVSDGKGKTDSETIIITVIDQIPPDTTPPTITDVSASSVTSNSAIINWTTNEPATSEVQYGTTINYGNQTTLDTTKVISHSVSLTGLTAETTYHFRVISKDSNNNLQNSSDFTFTTLAPPIPTNNPPVLNAIGNKSVDEGEQLIFSVSATDPDGDTLTYSASNLPSGVSFIASTRTFSWTPTETQSGTYVNIIFSVSDGKGGQDSETITITVIDVDTTPPVISNVTSSNITTTSATITWRTDEQGTSKVEYGTATNYGQQTPTDAQLVSLHSQNLTNLLPNTVYHYRVISKDSSNNQTSSPDYTFSTLKSAVQPTLIISLTAQPNSGTGTLSNVSLTASVSGTAQGNINYTFYCNRPDTGTNITTPYQSKYDNISETIKTAQNLCDYTAPGTYFAKAIVERGNLRAQAQAEIKVNLPPQPPKVPSNLTTSAVSYQQINLSWTDNSDNEQGFSIERKKGILGTYSEIATVIENKNSYPDSNLLPETSYYYRLRAYNKDGYSFYSNEDFATTKAKPEEIVIEKAPPTEIIAPVEKPISQMTVPELKAKITEVKVKIIQLKTMLIEILKQKIAEIQLKIIELQTKLSQLI